MKVIAKKIFYETDLYHYPDENVSYGLFPKEEHGMFTFPVRKGPVPVVVHSKGDFKEWKFEIKKYCCEKLKKYIDEEEIIFRDFFTFDKDKKRIFHPLGAFVNCPCWHSLLGVYRIDYCPCCGKKIEIEEEK